MTLPVIAITMGDPSGIGPEIIARALADDAVTSCCRPLVIGDLLAMERAVALTGSHQQLVAARSDELPDEAAANVINVSVLSGLESCDMEYGKPTTAAGDAVFRYITHGAGLCLSGKAAAMATAPINKEALNRAGHHYPGHTELLAELTATPEFVMMLAGDRLRVCLVTIHEALADIPRLVTFEKVLSTIRIVNTDVGRYFRAKPRIAVLALNPHAGEGGLFGDEEERIIKPAIKAARAEGINASGPHSADTLFHFAVKGEYDAVVCMYHDQGLIPLKLLHFDDGVNITLGLPIIRTSVDHGTAYDLAGKGTANHESMKAAIILAAHMALSQRTGQK
jgi:4-hydroxythreonine-4-phosphate dehydrogenase